MSRSKKRTPYFGIVKARSAKPYKRYANAHFRAMERAAIRTGHDPHDSLKVTLDPRLSAYDDKRYRIDATAKDMRK